MTSFYNFEFTVFEDKTTEFWQNNPNKDTILDAISTALFDVGINNIILEIEEVYTDEFTKIIKNGVDESLIHLIFN